MTRKPTDWFPGKPGPAPTGLKRKIPFPLMLDVDESEHLNRLEKEAREKNFPLKRKAQIARARLFPPGELERLRREQGANIE